MILVRKAQPLDFALIAEFQLKMARETEGLSLDIDTVTRGVKQVFAHPGYGCYYVAEENDQVVASLLTTYEWSDWRNAKVLWIQSVYVLPAYRKMGVFRKMYDYIREAVLADPSLAGIRLYVDKSNVTAQQVYRKVGMDGDHYALFEWMK